MHLSRLSTSAERGSAGQIHALSFSSLCENAPACCAGGPAAAPNTPFGPGGLFGPGGPGTRLSLLAVFRIHLERAQAVCCDDAKSSHEGVR